MNTNADRNVILAGLPWLQHLLSLPAVSTKSDKRTRMFLATSTSGHHISLEVKALHRPRIERS